MNTKLNVNLISSDIGATLTLGEGQNVISSLDQKAVTVVQQLGKIFVLTTGRTLTRTLPVIKQLKPSYAICSSGGLIYSVVTQKILHIFPINRNFRQKLLVKLHSTKNVFTAFQCINDKKELMSFYIGKPNCNFFQKKVRTSNLHPLKNDAELIKWEVVRISVYGATQHSTSFSTFLKKFNQIINYHIDVDKHLQIQITDQNINKGAGISFLAKQIGIKKTKILVFGNSFNDITVFQVAKYGIATANAVLNLKAIAFAETDAPNQSGVGKALYKWVIPD